jgi:membrane-bound lytic murein transglycosylase D
VDHRSGGSSNVASSPIGVKKLKQEAPLNLHRLMILLATLGVALTPGRDVGAVTLGPDLPGWAAGGPGATHATPAAPDEPQVTVSDPLSPIHEKLSRAQDLAQSGHSPEALALVEEGIKDLNGLSPSRPGVASLREQLEEVRTLCTRVVPEAQGAEDAARDSDGDRPRLKPVVPERNARVDKWIDYYSGRGREHFQLWLSRSGSYMDLLTRNLRAEGVPEELANLVFVESGFNMHAKSVARAVGPWQFIRGTAKLFGLEMTPYVDQRRDPELATRAAARYLRRLYGMFDGSWTLALAAYNSGEGTVQRAIRRQKTNDFWSLRLPRETREYVPKFMAAMEIASDPERYGFDVPENSPWKADYVVVSGPVDLKLLSSVAEVPLEELERLNPSFMRHRAPAGKEGTTLRVPHGSGDQIQSLLETEYSPKPLSRTELKTATKAHRLEIKKSARRGRAGRYGTHVVRRGETLSEIAARHGTSATRLAQLNGLASTGTIRAGQRIRVR